MVKDLVQETLNRHDEETIDDMLYVEMYKPNKNHSVKGTTDYDYSYEDEDEKKSDLLDDLGIN